MSEECYSSPWNLKIQEEKFFNEQCQILPSNTRESLTDTLLHCPNINSQSTSFSIQPDNTNNSFHSICSVQMSSSLSTTTNQPFTHPHLSPSAVTPLRSGSVIRCCPCVTNNRTQKNNNPIIESLDLSSKKISNCLNSNAICSGIDTSRSFLFALTSSSSNNRTKKIDKILNTSHTPPLLYEVMFFVFRKRNQNVLLKIFSSGVFTAF